jgi:pimeloyl-ACP methyl ester carboxylesterase
MRYISPLLMTRWKLALSLVLIIAAFVAVTLLRAVHNEAQAEADFPPIGQFILVDGLRVHYVVRGQGPDLVLIHGLSGSLRDFTFDLVDLLADRYRVITFDRPGLGYSDALPRNAEGIFAQAAHLQKAAALLGADHPIVVGHSYGGAVALAWALNFPKHIAALVTISGPSHDWDTPMPMYYRALSNPIGAWLVAPLITAYVPESLVIKAINQTFEPQSVPTGYDAYFGANLTLRRESLRVNARNRASLQAEIRQMQTRYSELKLPFELLHGDVDTIVIYDIHVPAMQRHAPNLNVTRLVGIGHTPHHVAIPQVIAAIERATQ